EGMMIVEMPGPWIPASAGMTPRLGEGFATRTVVFAQIRPTHGVIPREGGNPVPGESARNRRMRLTPRILDSRFRGNDRGKGAGVEIGTAAWVARSSPAD